MKTLVRTFIVVALISASLIGKAVPASKPTFGQLRPSPYSLTINNIPVNCYSINGRNCVFIADLRILGVMIDHAGGGYEYQIMGYTRPEKTPSKLFKKLPASKALGEVIPLWTVSFGNTAVPTYLLSNRNLIHVSDLARIGEVAVDSKRIRVTLDEGNVPISEGFSPTFLWSGGVNIDYPPDDEQQVVFVNFSNVKDFVWAVADWGSMESRDFAPKDGEQPDSDTFLDFGYIYNPYARPYSLFFNSAFDLSLNRDAVRANTLDAVKRKVALYMPSRDTLAFYSECDYYYMTMDTYEKEQARQSAKASAKALYREYVSNGKRPLKIQTYSISYPSLYSAQIKFKVKNVTSKTVDSFILECHLYTKSGKPVPIGYRSKKNVSAINCTLSDPNFLLSGNSASFNTVDSLPSDIARIHPVITKVHFTDGSLWTP